MRSGRERKQRSSSVVDHLRSRAGKQVQGWAWARLERGIAMARDTEKEKCLGCNKKFTKSDYCLQCTVCGLWVHKSCSGVCDEVFDVLDRQHKNFGVAYWACRPCTAFAQGMNHRIKQIEDRMEKVEKEAEETRDSVKNLEKEMKSVGEETKKRKDNTKEEVRSGVKEVYAEMREREARRLNVVFHRVGEAENEKATGLERQEWDKKSCGNIFAALELDMTDKDIKFCRRIGEKGDGPRPLIAGFYNEAERNKVLRYGKYLGETDFKDVTVGPDLTKVQRDEEKDLREEAEKKNEELTEEDISKNLQWTVVGPKGEKRLIKTVQRERDWTRGGGKARIATGMRGGRTRQEQRTNTGGFKGTGRGEKEKQPGRSGVEARVTDLSGEESEMERDEETPAAMARKGKATKRKERSPAAASPPGKR